MIYNNYAVTTTEEAIMNGQNTRAMEDEDDSFGVTDEDFLLDLDQTIKNNFDETVEQCRKVIVDALTLAGPHEREQLEMNLTLEYQPAGLKLYRRFGLVFLSFIPLYMGSPFDAIVKCSLRYSNWKVLGAYVTGIDGRGPTMYFAIDDWTDKDNPRLICTGKDLDGDSS